jgi:hypothetical protein
VSIYPNPSSDIFTFSKSINTVQVYTLLGELVLTDNNTNQINLQDYPKGMYLALINGEQVNKLVKE